jgi:hypothetical protein
MLSLTEIFIGLLVYMVLLTGVMGIIHQDNIYHLEKLNNYSSIGIPQTSYQFNVVSTIAELPAIVQIIFVYIPVGALIVLGILIVAHGGS